MKTKKKNRQRKSPASQQPRVTVSELAQRADIVKIIGKHVKLKKSGKTNYNGLCPFHSETSPSFTVHVTRKFFHCFGCGASGDVIGFLAKLHKTSPAGGAAVLAETLGLEIDIPQKETLATRLLSAAQQIEPVTFRKMVNEPFRLLAIHGNQDGAALIKFMQQPQGAVLFVPSSVEDFDTTLGSGIVEIGSDPFGPLGGIDGGSFYVRADSTLDKEYISDAEKFVKALKGERAGEEADIPF